MRYRPSKIRQLSLDFHKHNKISPSFLIYATKGDIESFNYYIDIWIQIDREVRK